MARITIDPEMACEQIALEPDACCEYICFEVGDYSPTFVTDLPDYSGVTTVAPSMDAQTLETANTALHDNITVEAIPYDEVEAATPVISVDSGGKVTATTNQQGGIVESSTKSAEYQQPTVEQATPDISVDSDGVITATATQTGGFVAGGSKTATLAQETVEQATPTISVDNDGKITASATQTGGFVASGTKSATYSLPTQAAATITPTESAQTAVMAGKWTTGAVQVGAIPSDYIKPSGTLPITSNGTYDVAHYASASVEVPEPTGTLSITENGSYDVASYAGANVNVAGGASSYQLLASAKFTVTQAPTSMTEIGTFSISPYNPLSSEKILVFETRRDDFAVSTQIEFYGNTVIYYTSYGANGETTTALTGTNRMYFSYSHDGTKWQLGLNGANHSSGVMSFTVDADGTCHVGARQTANSGNILGTYTVYAYSLDFPDGLIPFTV